MTNREVTTTERNPERFIVLGGGAVGVEMAEAFTSLGSTVVRPVLAVSSVNLRT
ncbi:MAG: FAD-dependent oxidoreductase [Solirubrobacteraceae bacterium]